MAFCEKCSCFDDNHAENIDYPKGLTEEQEEQWLDSLQDYEPHRYYYWHADIQEDYQMPPGYECLCERCFGDFLGEGKIIEKFDDLTGEPNPNWNPETMGWFMPDN